MQKRRIVKGLSGEASLVWLVTGRAAVIICFSPKIRLAHPLFTATVRSISSGEESKFTAAVAEGLGIIARSLTSIKPSSKQEKQNSGIAISLFQS
jgi:hypothetical protein